MKRSIFLGAVFFASAALLSAASITVTCPNGGDLQLGKTVTITWNSSGVSGNVKISILKDGNWVAFVKTGVPVSPGSFLWKVGQKEDGSYVAAGTGYKIRVKAGGSEIKGESPNSFTISALQVDWKHLLAKFKKIVLINPDPDPGCPQCFKFDIRNWMEEIIRFRKVNKIDDDIAWHLELRSANSKIVDLGTFGKGSRLPAEGKLRLALNDSQKSSLRVKGVKLVVLGANGKIISETAVEVQGIR